VPMLDPISRHLKLHVRVALISHPNDSLLILKSRKTGSRVVEGTLVEP